MSEVIIPMDSTNLSEENKMETEPYSLKQSNQNFIPRIGSKLDDIGFWGKVEYYKRPLNFLGIMERDNWGNRRLEFSCSFQDSNLVRSLKITKALEQATILMSKSTKHIIITRECEVFSRKLFQGKEELMLPRREEDWELLTPEKVIEFSLDKSQTYLIWKVGSTIFESVLSYSITPLLCSVIGTEFDLYIPPLETTKMVANKAAIKYVFSQYAKRVPNLGNIDYRFNTDFNTLQSIGAIPLVPILNFYPSWGIKKKFNVSVCEAKIKKFWKDVEEDNDIKVEKVEKGEKENEVSSVDKQRIYIGTTDLGSQLWIEDEDEPQELDYYFYSIKYNRYITMPASLCHNLIEYKENPDFHLSDIYKKGFKGTLNGLEDSIYTLSIDSALSAKNICLNVNDMVYGTVFKGEIEIIVDATAFENLTRITLLEMRIQKMYGIELHLIDAGDEKTLRTDFEDLFDSFIISTEFVDLVKEAKEELFGD